MQNLTSNITTSHNNLSTLLSDEQLPPLRQWLYTTNLLIYAVEFPITIFSAFTVLSSAILHPNLKLVLVCQNACFFIFALSRTLQTGLIFALGPNGWKVYKSIQCGLLFSTLYGNMIGHVLLVERLLATFFVKDYEHKQRLWFPLCWFPSLFAISLINAYSETYQSSAADASLNVTLGTLVSLFISLAMSFAEIFILSLMGVHNRKAYNEQRGQHVHGGRSLAERYQLSENIRTSKQLGPTFLFHFANICCTTLLGASMYFEWVADVYTLMAIIFWFNSLFNTIIETSVVILHPILRRNAKASMARLVPSITTCCCCLAPIMPHLGGGKVHATNGGGASCATTVVDAKAGPRRGGQMGPTNIDGQTLIHRHGHEDYFRLLTDSWRLDRKAIGEGKGGGVSTSI